MLGGAGPSGASAAYPRPVTTPDLTHVDASGAARMVDVSGKDVTVRLATAAGRVQTTADVVTGRGYAADVPDGRLPRSIAP